MLVLVDLMVLEVIVDQMFERLEAKDPDHFAVRQYKKFLLSAGKTRSSILIMSSVFRISLALSVSRF